jgi:hypothetical protein
VEKSEEINTLHLDRFEAAGIAKVHPHTLDAARERGEITFMRVGPHRKVVFERHDVLEWAERRTTPVRVDRLTCVIRNPRNK